MEEKNPFDGIKTCGNFSQLWRLTALIFLCQVAASTAVAFFERRSGIELSPFEAMIPALLATALISRVLLAGLGVSRRAALADWSRGAASDLKKAFKYFAGYLLVLICVLAVLLAAYWFLGDGLAKVMKPLSDKNVREDGLLQGVAAVSRLRFLLVLFSACALAPAVEEIFFRRIVYSAIRLKKGFWFSAFWSGLLFAVFHGAAAPVILPAGMYLCWVYERERRLPVNILLHSLINLSMLALKVLI